MTGKRRKITPRLAAGVVLALAIFFFVIAERDHHRAWAIEIAAFAVVLQFFLIFTPRRDS